MSSQHDLRQALLDKAGETGRLALDAEPTPLYIDLTSGILLDLLTAINAANGTRHFCDPSDDRDLWYSYTTRNRQWKLGAAADAAVDNATAGTAIDGWRVSADTVVNQQVATVDTPTFPLAPITVWEWGSLPPLPLTVRAAEPLTVEATYSDYVLDCPVVHAASSGDPLTVTVLHHGYSSTITLASSGTTTVTSFSAAGRQAVRSGATTHSADDLSSQAPPRGVRAGPEIGGDMAGPMSAAAAVADHMVWRYAQPSLRPSLTVVNWLPQAFRLDLYDLVSVTSAQLRVSGLIFEVVGISERCDMAAGTGAVHWTTTYQLQESRLQSSGGFLVWDASSWDAAVWGH